MTAPRWPFDDEDHPPHLRRHRRRNAVLSWLGIGIAVLALVLLLALDDDDDEDDDDSLGRPVAALVVPDDGEAT